MPITIQLPDAANPTKKKYRMYLSEAERIFQFTQAPVDFISNGIVSNDQFTSVLDGDPILRRFRNMTINAGHVVIPTIRCKGMYLLIEGDLTVNGTLTMSTRGAKAAGKFVGIDPDNELIYFNETDIFSTLNIFTIAKIGGAAATSINKVGTAGKNNAGAGGGCGVVEPAVGGSAGYGSNGTSFSGGAGGGGAPRNVAGNGQINGGSGGIGVSYLAGPDNYTAGGGAGNYGGAGGTGGGAGLPGTGGLMILIVKGNIIFGSNGKIISAGTKGGNGYTPGGGSGGGAIHIFHKGIISNPEKITAPGGLGGNPIAAGGYPGYTGLAGGAGSISINQM